MNIAFYSAASGLTTQENGINIYSNNIANVNTVGYKALRPSFADCIYTVQRATEPEWQTGHGQYIQKTDFMWEKGQFTASEQELDFAIPNDDFFMVMDEDGNSWLTRDGSFELSFIADSAADTTTPADATLDGVTDNTADTTPADTTGAVLTGHWELVNANGEFVLDAEGNHIIVPFATIEQNIMDEEGNITGTEEIITDTVDYDTLYDMIGLYSVDNNWGLEQGEDNHFVVTDRSGEPAPTTNRELVRKALEMSTVDLASEMVHLIETQRSYQLNAKIVQTSDEMASIANNLR